MINDKSNEYNFYLLYKTTSDNKTTLATIFFIFFVHCMFGL